MSAPRSADDAADRWSDVELLLHQVLEQPTDERARFLDRTCTDQRLRREVETLLDAHDRPGMLDALAERVMTPLLHTRARGPIAPDEPRYVEPLLRDLTRVAATWPGEVVLLGSVASPKYTAPMIAVLGERLLFPETFVGRGDMSRGGLLLRCAASGEELTYVPVAGAVRHGVRPPKLDPATRVKVQ